MAAALARLNRIRGTLTPAEGRRLGGFGAAVAGLHLLGFGILLLVVAPRYGTVLGIGVGLTAYGFGLRHAFDADHIAAIDNTTRKLMADGQRPLGVGFFFSLGHSTIVFALSFLLAVGAKAVEGQLNDDGSTLHNAGGYIGTGVSGFFLYIIALINIIILVGIIKVFRDMRRGVYDEETLEAKLNQRGFMNRFLGPLARSIKHSWQMYPVGLLFGLGFDTATEIGLLALAATAGGANLPWYAILCLPVLFAAGMSMMDTADGAFMSVAYGWAFSNPVRKVFYNVTITTLSITVALLVGTVEIISIGIRYFNLSGEPWDFLSGIDFNTIGFVIVGMFLVTWVVAIAVWRFGGIEERWALATAGSTGAPSAPRSSHASKSLVTVAAQTWLPTQMSFMAIGVVYLAIASTLINDDIGGAFHTPLFLLAIIGVIAMGLLLASLAVRMDGVRPMTAWGAAVLVETGCLVIGILTAHNYNGVIATVEIGAPIVGLALLLWPSVLMSLRRAPRARLAATPAD